VTFFDKNLFKTIYAMSATTVIIMVHLVYHCGFH
jgi:hypothetical protein